RKTTVRFGPSGRVVHVHVVNVEKEGPSGGSQLRKCSIVQTSCISSLAAFVEDVESAAESARLVERGGRVADNRAGGETERAKPGVVEHLCKTPNLSRNAEVAPEEFDG